MMASSKRPASLEHKGHPSYMKSTNMDFELELDQHMSNSMSATYLPPSMTLPHSVTPTSKSWDASEEADPDVKRKKRLAAYNALAVERKVKTSMQKHFSWIKEKYLDFIYGLN